MNGYKDYFVVDSFSFAAERELKDSGQGGTADVNLGVVEMQECSIDKSFDTASMELANKAITGSSVGTAEIKFLETITSGTESKNVCYLQFKLDNAFVKSWEMSGSDDDRPEEKIVLWYNKIAFCYFYTPDGKEFKFAGDCAWDASSGAVWASPGLDTTATMT